MTDAAILGLLGLGVRAGGVAVGVDATRRALQRGRARCVVLAADASGRARMRVERLAERKGVPVVTGPSALALGARCGRPPVHAVAVEERGLAAGLLERFDRSAGE